jgi:predicted FMN-binding regulatory protein PaiB
MQEAHANREELSIADRIPFDFTNTTEDAHRFQRHLAKPEQSPGASTCADAPVTFHSSASYAGPVLLNVWLM